MKHITGGPYNAVGTCVAFGRFDGVHAGHRAVAETLIQTAQARGLVPVLVSPAPPDGATGILTTEAEKLYLLGDLPLETLLTLPQQPVDAAFIRDVLVAGLGAKAVVVGQNHEAYPCLKARVANTASMW